ncbi:MAG: hypothetical protein RR931_07730 [Mucinivorans sp.]
MLKITPLAAIDIGSNAVRLLITNVEQYQNETVFKKVTWVRVPLRLGADVFATEHMISLERQAHLLEIMQGFYHLMRAFDVQQYRACATSAMREAINGPQVVKYIRENSGVNIEIISGQDEAEIIMNSGLAEVVGNKGCYLFVDVGGGSTELTIFANGDNVASRSFPIGTVRMLAGTMEQRTPSDIKKWLKFQTLQYTPTAVVGSGGNISKVFKLLNKKEKETMTFAQMKILYDYIDSFTMEQRIHSLRLNPHRADVIIPALNIFLMVMKSTKINEVIVPKMGVVDGIIRTLYGKQKAQETEKS